MKMFTFSFLSLLFCSFIANWMGEAVSVDAVNQVMPPSSLNSTKNNIIIKLSLIKPARWRLSINNIYNLADTLIVEKCGEPTSG